jgi:hypothetical protein
VLAGVAGGLAVLVWCAFSRAPWAKRLGVVALIVAAMFAAQKIPGILDRSIVGE